MAPDYVFMSRISTHVRARGHSPASKAISIGSLCQQLENTSEGRFVTSILNVRRTRGGRLRRTMTPDPVSCGDAVSRAGAPRPGSSSATDVNGDREPDVGVQHLPWQCGSAGGCATDWKIVGLTDSNHDGHLDLMWNDPWTGQVATWLLDGNAGILGTQTLNTGTQPWAHISGSTLSYF